METIPMCLLLNKHHLFSITQHRFILIHLFFLHVCYMFRPVCGHPQRPLRFVLYLLLYDFHVDMPEDGLSVGQNMWGTCKFNQLNLVKPVLC